jgi:hypothetical protein
MPSTAAPVTRDTMVRFAIVFAIAMVMQYYLRRREAVL